MDQRYGDGSKVQGCNRGTGMDQKYGDKSEVQGWQWLEHGVPVPPPNYLKRNIRRLIYGNRLTFLDVFCSLNVSLYS